MTERLLGRRCSTTIELSRSQTETLANKLEPLKILHKNNRAVAKVIGVDDRHVCNILRRGAATRMSRDVLDKLAKVLDVDVSTWDVSVSDG